MTNSFESISHGHGLNTTAGYRVLQTMEAGAILPEPIDHGYFDEATSYGFALQEAQAIRRVEGSWAIVKTVYTCGCGAAEPAEIVELIDPMGPADLEETLADAIDTGALRLGPDDGLIVRVKSSIHEAKAAGKVSRR